MSLPVCLKTKTHSFRIKKAIYKTSDQSRTSLGESLPLRSVLDNHIRILNQTLINHIMITRKDTKGKGFSNIIKVYKYKNFLQVLYCIYTIHAIKYFDTHQLQYVKNNQRFTRSHP